MRRNVYLTMATLFAAGWSVFLGYSNQSRKVVTGSELLVVPISSRQNIPLDQVDHSTWDRLLQKYVDDNGMVNYAGWKASAGDSAVLEAYLASLSRANPTARTTREACLAFWINAYNALTIRGILDVYPTTSIRNHTAAVFGYNIWKDLLLPVGDKRYSLSAIENEILRKEGEPRIHFAIVCASIGCPRLLNRAYQPSTIESQLAENTRDFFARRGHLQVDLPRRQVRTSLILKWYSKDFGPTKKDALTRFADYMPDETTRRLIASKDFSVSYLDYDWKLNKQ